MHTTQTCLYNTPIKHTNLKISEKEKLAFDEVKKGGMYIRIDLVLSLYSLAKLTKLKVYGTEEQIKL